VVDGFLARGPGYRFLPAFGDDYGNDPDMPLAKLYAYESVMDSSDDSSSWSSDDSSSE
jgi:hypothetical protein